MKSELKAVVDFVPCFNVIFPVAYIYQILRFHFKCLYLFTSFYVVFAFKFGSQLETCGIVGLIYIGHLHTYNLGQSFSFFGFLFDLLANQQLFFR